MTLIPVMVCQILAVKVIVLIQVLLNPEVAPRRFYFCGNSSKNVWKFPRKHSEKVTCLLHLYWNWTLQCIFFLGVSQTLLEQLFPIIPWSSCSCIKGFCNLMSVFALTNSCCKMLWETPFHSYQVLPFEFCKVFVKSRFSEHRHGFAFAMTNCLLEERVGKRKKKLVSYKNHSIVTLCKLINWFLFDKSFYGKVFPKRL